MGIDMNQVERLQDKIRRKKIVHKWPNRFKSYLKQPGASLAQFCRDAKYNQFVLSRQLNEALDIIPTQKNIDKVERQLKKVGV